MDINLRVVLELDGAGISLILTKLDSILVKEVKIMSALDNLQAQVAATRTVAASAVTLLNGLKDALDKAIASNDPTKIQQFADDLGASTTALAAAVTADTPGGAAPATPATPADPAPVLDPGAV